MKRYALLSVLIIIITIAAIFSSATGDNETVGSCPEMCVESLQICEHSCSQLIGGGAKSEKRRECIKECGSELEGCKVRCLNPTPRPTLKPEAYYDRSCKNACELKQVDCNETCTKYMGGGAKSEKKTACRKQCSESLDYCNKRCADPSLPKILKSPPNPDLTCAENCDYKLQDCEAGCSKYIGGGAKSGKKANCVSECRGGFQDCSGLCGE